LIFLCFASIDTLCFASIDALSEVDHHAKLQDSFAEQIPERVAAVVEEAPSPAAHPSIRKITVRGHQLFAKNTLTEGRHGKSKDSLEAYFPFKFKKHQWVVGWKPLVGKQKCPGTNKDVELPHHMNIITGHHDSGTRFLATYDRGAREYHLPQDEKGRPLYGIPVGKLPARLEYHLLVPKCWDFEKKPSVLENSGFDIYVTDTAPKFNAAIVGAMDQKMKIHPNAGTIEHSTVISPTALLKMFEPAGDLVKLTKWPSKIPRVDILAVHMHTHEIFQRKSFEIITADGKTKFRSKPEKTGYGSSEQSMLSLKQKRWPKLSIQVGDTLVQHCIVDADRLKETLTDGTSWGNEMCAPMFIVGGKGIITPRTQLSMTHGFNTQM